MRLVPGPAVRRLGVVGVTALVFTASGLAYVCHPDLPGTRSLGVGGRVDAYALSAARVTIHAWVRGCERTIVWRPTAAASSVGGCKTRPAATPPRREASDGRHRVVLISGSRNPDLPDRLAVYDARTGTGLHAWPLPASASSVDVARGLAVLSTSNGVYVLRLSDGRFALLGVKRQGDRPQIGPAGMVFNDDLYKRRSAGRSLLKFLPYATSTHALRPFGPLRVPARIGEFSLDGRSVIFVKKDPTGECDRIGVWTIPWHYSTDLMDEPPICPERHAAGGIEALALGGQYVEVLTRYGNVQTLVSSTFVRCIEKIVTRTRIGTGAIPAVAADGSTLAYAVRAGAGPAQVGRLLGQRPAGTAQVPSAVSLSVDRGRLAVLGAGGRVDVLQDNRVLQTFEQIGATALALRGNELTVVTRAGTLDTYGLWEGRLLHRWRLPAGTSPAVDVHYGVAVVSAGRQLFAVSLSSRRQRVLLRAPQPVRAHLDDIGVVYAYNAGRTGVLGFIPFAAVERALAA